MMLYFAENRVLSISTAVYKHFGLEWLTTKDWFGWII